jgi:molybdopterin converting factor small subunit
VGVRVHLYSGLKEFTGGRNITEVQGATVGECLADLVKQFPRMEPELFDQKGQLAGKVLVSVNLKSTYPEELTGPVADEDELYIVRVIAGG